MMVVVALSGRLGWQLSAPRVRLPPARPRGGEETWGGPAFPCDVTTGLLAEALAEVPARRPVVGFCIPLASPGGAAAHADDTQLLHSIAQLVTSPEHRDNPLRVPLHLRAAAASASAKATA